MERDTHRDHWVARRDGPGVVLHMRQESFNAESAAFIVVENTYNGYFDREDADYWYDLAVKGGIVFW